MDQTPIYTAAINEAKRRTRKGSAERTLLDTMHRETAPDWTPVPNVAGSPFTREILDAMEATR